MIGHSAWRTYSNRLSTAFLGKRADACQRAVRSVDSPKNDKSPANQRRDRPPGDGWLP